MDKGIQRIYIGDEIVRISIVTKQSPIGPRIALEGYFADGTRARERVTKNRVRRIMREGGWSSYARSRPVVDQMRMLIIEKQLNIRSIREILKRKEA